MPIKSFIKSVTLKSRICDVKKSAFNNSQLLLGTQSCSKEDGVDMSEEPDSSLPCREILSPAYSEIDLDDVKEWMKLQNDFVADTGKDVFHVGLSSKEIKQKCKGLGRSGVQIRSILPYNLPPPSPPEPPKKEKPSVKPLHLPANCVVIHSKMEAFDPNLQQYCSRNPITIIQGLTESLKLNLDLFSTATLAKINPKHPVELRLQLPYQHPSFENIDSDKRKVWSCYSRRDETTLAKYAKYQASEFLNLANSIREESMRITRKRGALNSQRQAESITGTNKEIKFGTNVDLSDGIKWKAQLRELDKLPGFVKVISAENMLSYVGAQLLGMNTVQLYLKVPGCRTPGHQENNNFCSVNLNVGPGDCKWFAVHEDFWGAIQSLCEEKGMKFLKDSWWPDLDDCKEAGIPVYSFTQKPGDLVWVNIGCVHWVQAVGCCNNVAWNVGPITARQFLWGIQRYEWNKLQDYKSIVPMIRLSWNLARVVPISEPILFQLVRGCLLKTLVNCFEMLEFLEVKKIQINFKGRKENEDTHYCDKCQVEVFNFLLVKDKNEYGAYVVHCIDCAQRFSPDLEGYTCLEEHDLLDLMDVYDHFVLHDQNTQRSLKCQ